MKRVINHPADMSQCFLDANEDCICGAHAIRCQNESDCSSCADDSRAPMACGMPAAITVEDEVSGNQLELCEHCLEEYVSDEDSRWVVIARYRPNQLPREALDILNSVQWYVGTVFLTGTLKRGVFENVSRMLYDVEETLTGKVSLKR